MAVESGSWQAGRGGGVGAWERLNVISHLERGQVDPPYVPPFVVAPGTYDASLAKMARHEDTSDFDMLYLLNLWLGYHNDPGLDPALVAQIENVIPSFEYWVWPAWCPWRA